MDIEPADSGGATAPHEALLWKSKHQVRAGHHQQPRPSVFSLAAGTTFSLRSITVSRQSRRVSSTEARLFHHREETVSCPQSF